MDITAKKQYPRSEKLQIQIRYAWRFRNLQLQLFTSTVYDMYVEENYSNSLNNKESSCSILIKVDFSLTDLPLALLFLGLRRYQLSLEIQIDLAHPRVRKVKTADLRWMR